MTDKQHAMSQAEGAQAGDEPGYDPSAIEVLATMVSRRRPWQLLMTGAGTDQLDAEVCEKLARILDVFPTVSHLVIKTTVGDCHVLRDFSKGYTEEVDQHLVGIFHGNPAVTGIVFPATSSRPSHTATPDDPHWSPEGKARANIMAAFGRGEISPNDAISQLNDIHR